MDREEIEDMVHASLGRHLRVTCVLGLLFLAVGFVLGHFVAAQHSRELSDRGADRVNELSKQVSQLEGKLTAELTKVRESTLANQTVLAKQQAEMAQLSRQTEQLQETRGLTHASDEQRQSVIARCIAENQREKARLLEELKPFLDRNMTIKATEVSEAVNRLVDTHVAQLRRVAEVQVPVVAEPVLSDTAPPDISSVSAQGGADHCPAPDDSPLVPVADVTLQVTTPERQELVPLMPMPSTPIIRMPVQAEPSSRSTVKSDNKSQFFSAPRQPRLFISSRKPLEMSSATDPVVR